MTEGQFAGVGRVVILLLCIGAFIGLDVLATLGMARFVPDAGTRMLLWLLITAVCVLGCGALCLGLNSENWEDE